MHGKHTIEFLLPHRNRLWGMVCALLAATLFGGILAPARAQDSKQVVHTTLFGTGRARILDTYLSPYEYSGPQVTVLHESMRRTQRRGLIFLSTTEGNLAYTENTTSGINDICGDISFDAGWMHDWRDTPVKGLTLAAGGLMGGNLGFLYNTRNGNNPAQARASARLSLAASAGYTFRIRRTPLTLRYQAHFPLVGMMFSPQYGQSYYEIFSLGQHEHTLVPTHPGNALALRQQFSVDIPLGRSCLRVAYLSDLRQWQPNNLEQYHRSRAFLVGYVKQMHIDRKHRKEVDL